MDLHEEGSMKQWSSDRLVEDEMEGQEGWCFRLESGSSLDLMEDQNGPQWRFGKHMCIDYMSDYSFPDGCREEKNQDALDENIDEGILIERNGDLMQNGGPCEREFQFWSNERLEDGMET